MAPTRASSGRSANGDWMGSDFTTTGVGRRVGEKIGRSRVAVNEVRGIAHNGLPCPTEPCNFGLLRGRSAVVGTLLLAIGAGTGFVMLRGSVCIPSVVNSETVGVCEAALTIPMAAISPTRMVRLGYENAGKGITLHLATVRTLQVAPAFVRLRRSALRSVLPTDR